MARKRFVHGHNKRLYPNRLVGEDHPSWKGGAAGVQGIHYWVRKNFEKTGRCEECGSDERETEWSNVEHTYRRVREDWRELCPACHGKADADLRRRKEWGSIHRYLR